MISLSMFDVMTFFAQGQHNRTGVEPISFYYSGVLFRKNESGISIPLETQPLFTFLRGK
jgi:hypothetical protein